MGGTRKPTGRWVPIFKPSEILNQNSKPMKRIFLSLMMVLYVTFSLSGCKSFVTSAPEQWVAKVDDAIVLIEDTKGLIELARELGMEWITLIKQKDGKYAVKDNTEKESKAVTPSGVEGQQIQGIMSTSLDPGTDPNELRIPLNTVIRRTRVVH